MLSAGRGQASTAQTWLGGGPAIPCARLPHRPGLAAAPLTRRSSRRFVVALAQQGGGPAIPASRDSQELSAEVLAQPASRDSQELSAEVLAQPASPSASRPASSVRSEAPTAAATVISNISSSL